MLDLLRRKAQSPYLQATVIIIILVFVFWGVGVNRGTSPNIVAKVNDDIVSYEEYQRAYDRLYNQLRDQFGGNVPDALVKNLNMKNQVVDQLVQQVLLKQGAMDMGIRVSDDELRQKIQEMEAFRNNEAFDVGLYREILTSSRITPTDFESGVKTDLLSGKVLDHFSRFVKVGPSELKERFAFDNEEYQFDYAVLNASEYEKKVQFSDKDIDTFFDENKDNYQTQPQYKLKYVSFPFAEISTEDLTDDEIKDYYQKNITRYLIPEERRARHILLKSGPGDADEQVAEKRKKAEEILAKIKKGEDFAELAKKHSEDTSAKKGGDLGFFSRGQMVKPFEDAVFSLQQGEVSDIVNTSFGFHLIKLEEITPASTRPLDKVRKGIENQLVKEQGKNIALKKANQAYEKIILAGSIDKYGEAGETEIKETDYFAQESPPKALANDPVFVKTAFLLRKGELSSLAQTGKGYVIIYVADEKEPQIPALAEVKKRVEEDYRQEQSIQMAKERAEQLLADLKDGASFQEKAKKIGSTVKKTGFISRRSLGSTDLPVPIFENAFTLTSEQPFPEEIGASGEAFYVYAFAEKKDPDPKLFDEKQAEYKEQIMQENKTALLDSWIRQMRQRAEITINQQFL